MASSTDSVKDIFGNAREIPDRDQRKRYLDEACAGDESLRAEVDRLLDALDSAGDFLGGSYSPATAQLPISERPGDTIGPYKLLQQIGEGGMGAVYMAEQTEPIERRVALKIIKPGMDTRQVIARFEAERQALAMMDHPNIARVLDAGVTDTGRPYFVMELVKGMPITEYCDLHHLTPRERLELFVPVCQAIQHAHQKGIIHRDIKPSNVLVAHYDDQPIPKIIDFGVAKAIDHRLTEKTLFTEFGQVLGTIEYMSPEQARLNQWDVDTRTDIYSLGVLLYELLIGETPFDRERLRSAAFDDLLRIIREEEPPRPSDRVSASHSLPTIAANRQLEPRKLTELMHGELDWIVMKALEKDRSRRYDTASKFAEDAQHYLHNEPVEACPPSASYRFRKFARRNKAVLATTMAIAASLILGIVGTSWQAIERGHEAERARAAEHLAREEAKRADAEAKKAKQERDRAMQAEQIADDQRAMAERQRAVAETQRAAAEASAKTSQAAVDYLVEMLGSFSIAKRGRAPTIDDVLTDLEAGIDDRFADEPLTKSVIQTVLGTVYAHRGQTELARSMLESAWEIRRQLLGDADETVQSGILLTSLPPGDDGLALAEEVLAMSIRVHRPSHPATWACRSTLARQYAYSGDNERALDMYQQVLRDRQGYFGENSPETRATQKNIGIVLLRLDRSDDALKVFNDVLQLRGPGGQERAGYADTLYDIAKCHIALGQTEKAESILLEVIERRRKLFGPGHRHVVPPVRRLAHLYVENNRRADAIAQLKKALELTKNAVGADDHYTVQLMYDLGLCHLDGDNYEAAIPPLRAAKNSPQFLRAIGSPLTPIGSTEVASQTTLRHQAYEAYLQLAIYSFENDEWATAGELLGGLTWLTDEPKEKVETELYRSMSLWHAGKHQAALQSYADVTNWMKDQDFDQVELSQLRSQASQLLNVEAATEGTSNDEEP
ncbi:tetratricopeptide repeat protein [Aeoliella sp. ICT_H6.2]|uniref:Tetratricopeptide repeat protein n=1 Tax=Aeoliella straminimaris TaxID=2954799 RepID=A0A9X2FG65_9BACT|nr:tetratricopeptide repeat protein [Aeoliella straminimaris]MCO6045111.1 tetratricopeptide repeat protein [Aeoliella straminimaris]